MKNIDNDIQQFEKNLIEIDAMRNQISGLKESLDKMLKETADINSIKIGINKEIESIHDINECSIKQIESEIKNLNDITIDIKKYMERDMDSIIESLKLPIEELSKKIDNIQHNMDERFFNLNKKSIVIIVLLLISIIIGIIGMFI